MTRLAWFDAREGLPAPALDGLRRAYRVAFKVRDQQTAAIGYWLDQASAVDLASLPCGVILVHCDAEARLPALGFRPEVVFQIRNAHHDPDWGRVVALLRTDDRLVLRDWSPRRRATLVVVAGGTAEVARLELRAESGVEIDKLRRLEGGGFDCACVRDAPWPACCFSLN